jgi:hypothetical protein
MRFHIRLPNRRPKQRGGQKLSKADRRLLERIDREAEARHLHEQELESRSRETPEDRAIYRFKFWFILTVLVAVIVVAFATSSGRVLAWGVLGWFVMALVLGLREPGDQIVRAVLVRFRRRDRDQP